MSQGALSSQMVLGAVLVSALSLAGSFYVADEVLAAFCLGAFFAFLCVTVLGLSYRMHFPAVGVRASRSSTSNPLRRLGINPAGRAVSLEIELHRDTGSRLSGVLSATCRGSQMLNLSRLDVVKPVGCRLAVGHSGAETVEAAAPVSIEFSDESGALDVEVGPDRPFSTRFFVLLPPDTQPPPHMQFSVRVVPANGPPFARRIKTAIP